MCSSEWPKASAMEGIAGTKMLELRGEMIAPAPQSRAMIHFILFEKAEYGRLGSSILIVSKIGGRSRGSGDSLGVSFPSTSVEGVGQS